MIAVDLHSPATSRDLPGPTSLDWRDPDIAARIADWADRVLPSADHSRIHPVAQHGCPGCPPVACRCGSLNCVDASRHRWEYASCETTWREAAS